jgi:hypothetical protein
MPVSRLSWNWRKRSFAKIAERTYEKRAQALHRRRESHHSEETPLRQDPSSRSRKMGCSRPCSIAGKQITWGWPPRPSKPGRSPAQLPRCYRAKVVSVVGRFCGPHDFGWGAVDNAANLARCKSLRRQLPVFGRLGYPVRAEATKHVLPGRKSLGRPTAQP